MEHVIATTAPGDPEAVLRALDAFGRRDFLMNIGDEKDPLLTGVVGRARPRVVLELGCVRPCRLCELCVWWIESI